MNLGLNTEEPNVMHIDLNSCFATVEQQAHPSLRGKPVGITNRVSPNCCIITCSYEAKARGVQVGSRWKDAKVLVPDMILLESDPPKYTFAYEKLLHIMKSYSPNVKMKSIDEGLIYFHGTRETINTRPLPDIGHEIKQRLRDDMGCWMKCNIGIAPNQFLAKLAAGLHKPDGMDYIDHRNLRKIYSQLTLLDLPGINVHYEARLNACGIFTPLQFLDAPVDMLHRHVFKSIVGEQWYKRLRGYEIDNRPTKMSMVGRQHVLHESSKEDGYLLPRLQFLAQTTAMKLRYRNAEARGLAVWARMDTGEAFVQRKMFKSTFYSDRAIWERTLLLFNRRPRHMRVRCFGLYCYQLTPSTRNQMSLVDDVNRESWLTEAVDEINDRYGGFAITYANVGKDGQTVKQKIPFGGTEYFDLLCKRA